MKAVQSLADLSDIQCSRPIPSLLPSKALEYDLCFAVYAEILRG